MCGVGGKGYVVVPNPRGARQAPPDACPVSEVCASENTPTHPHSLSLFLSCTQLHANARILPSFKNSAVAPTPSTRRSYPHSSPPAARRPGVGETFFPDRRRMPNARIDLHTLTYISFLHFCTTDSKDRSIPSRKKDPQAPASTYTCIICLNRQTNSSNILEIKCLRKRFSTMQRFD